MSSDSSLSDNQSHSEEESDQDYNPHIKKDNWIVCTQKEAAHNKEFVTNLLQADNSEKIIKCIMIMKKRDLLLISKIIKASGNCAFINQKTINSRSNLKCLSKHRSLYKLSINKGNKIELLRNQLLNLVRLKKGKYFKLALKAFSYKDNNE